jgi:hypothetical protein
MRRASMRVAATACVAALLAGSAMATIRSFECAGSLWCDTVTYSKCSMGYAGGSEGGGHWYGLNDGKGLPGKMYYSGRIKINDITDGGVQVYGSREIVSNVAGGPYVDCATHYFSDSFSGSSSGTLDPCPCVAGRTYHAQFVMGFDRQADGSFVHDSVSGADSTP